MTIMMLPQNASYLQTFQQKPTSIHKKSQAPFKVWDTGTDGGVAPYWTVSASGFLIAQILERSIKRNGYVFMRILAFELLVSHLEQSNSGVRNAKAAFAAH